MAAAASAQVATPPNDPGGQVAKFAAADMAKLLAAAPKPAVELPENLNLRLVDFIDCTNAADPHPFLSDGQGRVAQAPAGSYRETGPAANSYFAYRFRIADALKAHVVVLEFPDDADRLVALGLAQPPTGDPAKPAARVEFGFRTGDLLPTSGKMVTRWTIFHPTSPEMPALLVANWHVRMPAALARVWVYVVEAAKLPAVENETDRLLRSAGRYDGDPAAVGTCYGGQIENLVQSLGYQGFNEIAMDALAGRRFIYPSAKFNTGGRAIPDLLAALEGSGKRLITVFDPDCSVGAFSMPGQSANMADIGEGAVRKAWQELIETDFLKVYGTKPTLAGLMFGGPRGDSAFDLKNASGHTNFVTSLAAAIGKQYGGVRVYQNLAAPSPGMHYFQAAGAEGSLLERWESSDMTMDACLAENVSNHWRTYGVDEDSLGQVDSLVLMQQCDRDEPAALRFGHNALPRYWLLDAIARSGAVTQVASGSKLTGLVLSSRPAPRLMLLRPDTFWWTWTEMSPTLTPGGAGFFGPANRAIAVGLEPYTVWLAGEGAQTALHEADVRRWVTAFRNLPFRSFAPLEGAAQYPVAVRTYVYNAQRYVVLANVSPVTVTVTVAFDKGTAVRSFGAAITGEPSAVAFSLSPDDLVAFAISDRAAITGVRQSDESARAELGARLERFTADLQAARQAGAAMATRYDAVATAAREALAKGDLAQADTLLITAVTREPSLRRRLLVERPKAEVARLPALTVDGKLDEWKSVTPIRLNAAAQLVAAPHAANRWRGSEDLSAELYLGWNDSGLCYALKITDSQATTEETESGLLGLSARYRHPDRISYDYVLQLSRQAAAASPQGATVRSGATTVHEGFIPVGELPAELQPAAGRTVGLNLVVRDSDDRTGMPQAWCVSNLMAWSTLQDGYRVETDAQTCGEITFK
jgi:hypothetical protein